MTQPWIADWVLQTVGQPWMFHHDIMTWLWMVHELLQMVTALYKYIAWSSRVGLFNDSYRKEHTLDGAQAYSTRLKDSFTGAYTNETTFITICNVLPSILFDAGQNHSLLIQFQFLHLHFCLLHRCLWKQCYVQNKLSCWMSHCGVWWIHTRRRCDTCYKSVCPIVTKKTSSLTILWSF
jgi:hypothetical protein